MKKITMNARSNVWSLLAGLFLVTTAACSPAGEQEGRGSTTSRMEGEEYADEAGGNEDEGSYEEESGGSYEEEGNDDYSEEQASSDYDTYESNGDEDESSSAADDEAAYERESGGYEQESGGYEQESGGYEQESGDDEQDKTYDEEQDWPGSGEEVVKDDAHKPPPVFEGDYDRRVFNKQSNKASTPLEKQRYYNADGTYWKPNPKEAGLWDQYSAEGTRIAKNVRTGDLPAKVGAIGANEIAIDANFRVATPWCRMQQKDGFSALCEGLGSNLGKM